MEKSLKGTKNPSERYFEMSIRSPPSLTGKVEDGLNREIICPGSPSFATGGKFLITSLYK